MSTRHLPPMPGPITGEPRPPRAPVQDDWAPEERPAFEDAWLPKVPDDMSPMLEWHATHGRPKVVASALAVALALGYWTFLFRGFEWVTLWWAWAIGLGWAPVVYYVLGRDGRACAGADWYAGNRGLVNTYDLVHVKIRRSISWDVLLEDSQGGKTVTPLQTLQANRDLWDLVYNGIRHSVANGARTNQRARDWFRLG